MSKAPEKDELESLLAYASDAQRKHIESVIKHGSCRKAAEATGCNKGAVNGAIDRARRAQSLAVVRHDIDHSAAYATTTLYRDPTPDSQTPLQWVKRRACDEDRLKALDAAAQAVIDPLPQTPKVKSPKTNASDHANFFVLSDYHLGMLAWGEETGDDWDLSIAEDLLYRWHANAIERAPDADTAILANIGDFLHWDGMDAVTPASGHLLDVDTRYQKLIETGIRAMRRIIHMLLQTHKRVHVICATGNHDMSGSVWLRQLLAHVYENEPRLTVDMTPSLYYCYQFGDVSLFIHHGHKRSMTKDVESVFVSQYRDVFGSTKFSYGHLGHLHHNASKESNLMTLEQHRTMAARDAHAAELGFRSGRSAPVITYHKRRGEVGRIITTPEMVK